MKYPTRVLHDADGRVIAVCPNAHEAPAYFSFCIMSADAMRNYAQYIGGYIMQQDDGYLPPFQLYNFRLDRVPA